MVAAPEDSTEFPVIRPPKAIRIYGVVFMSVWCGGVLTGAISLAIKGSPAVIVALIMLVFGLTIGVRTFRVSATPGPDALLVRNFFRSRTLRRDEVEGFRVGPISNQPFGRTVYALLRDGGVFPLDVIGRPWLIGRGRARLEERRAMLQAWLDQTR